MDLRRMQLIVLTLIMALTPVKAQAAEKPNLSLKLSAQKEVVVKDEKGKTRTEWREVKSFEPGEVLKYTLSYKNEGKIEAHAPVIVDPIPANTTYVAGSAEGKNAEITFSLDGKSFQVPPLLKYTVKAVGTTEQEFSATPEMYSHIRWILTKPVPPGGSGSVSFKVKAK